MDEPIYVPLEQFERARGRPLEARAAGLWCAGSFEALARSCVAIVGTRAATPYGRRQAERFAAELGHAGCCILSGLALGIDACAHEGALGIGAPTIGVLGGGHRRFFPPRNRALAARIVEAGGAVLSPYAPDEVPRPHYFLHRNGVVAALADAVVVIEAPARSGALNTAGWGAGRIPVLAVPGDVDRRHSLGCLALIRDGATLARGPEDVLEALGRLPLQRRAPEHEPMAPDAAAVLSTLEAGPADLEHVVAATGLEACAALAALTLLELEGRVERRDCSTYARVG